MTNMFNHFLFPMTSNQSFLNFQYFHLITAFKTMGFPVFFFWLTLGVHTLTKKNNLKKNFVLTTFEIINNHFHNTHPKLASVVKGSALCNFKVSDILSSLFISLALINLGGMLSGMWAMTTWFNATMFLAFFMWTLTFLLSFYNYMEIFVKGTKLWQGEELMLLAGFFPSGTPLWLAPLMVVMEILSWVISFLSMGLRMAGNLVAGHVMLGMISYVLLYMDHLNLGFNFFFLFQKSVMIMAYSILFHLELAVAIIQAYVLTLLTSTFLKETESVH